MASSRKRQTVMTIAVVAVLGLFGLGAASAQQGAGSARSFDMPSVAPGGQVVVTLTVTGYGFFGAVTETLPAGFAYVSSSLGSDQVIVGPDESVGLSAGQVEFTLLGETSLTYTVTAPMAEGAHRFHGVLRDEDRTDHPIGGASEVTVAVSTPGPTVEPSPTPTPEPTTEPTPTPTAMPAPTPTPEPTTEPTPMPTAMLAPTPTPTSAPSPEPTATPVRAPSATPTSVPAAASTVTPTPRPTARPTPLPTVPVVSVDEGGGMPAWVVPVVVVAALLVLIAGAGVFITSRQR